MHYLDKNNDCEFAKYFLNLGYEYGWDFDGDCKWHELHFNGKMFFQVEMVPLDKIIQDLCATEERQLDYFAAIGGVKSLEIYEDLCIKVREFEKNKTNIKIKI